MVLFEPHIVNINEESLSPDIWQNITCDDGFDSDYCGKEENDGEMELSQFHEGPLFDNLVVTDQIPDMTFFKEPSSECQEETNVEGLPLYQDAPVTFAESRLLLMAFAVRHKLSGTALEDLLELVCFHCPKPNKCVSELKQISAIFPACEASIYKALLLLKYYLQNLHWNIPAVPATLLRYQLRNSSRLYCKVNLIY